MNRGAFKKHFSIGCQGMQCASRFGAILTIALGCLIAPDAKAQLTTFAQFFERGGESTFSYTSSGTAGAGGGASLSATGVAIYFQYVGGNFQLMTNNVQYVTVANLPADLAGIQNAHLTFTSLTSLGPTGSSSPA